MDNMKLWHSVCITDPAAVKPITGKQYKGNSPKPYWIIQRATETFGPCGTGWGVQVINERFERLTETDVLHVALVRVWYELDGKRGEIEQMGQTKASYKTRDGGTMVDEDAPKKSVTDGMVKCLSMLGFAGDIFSGQWDDSKYVEWAAQETARRENPGMSETAIADHLAAFEAAETLAALKKAGDLASSIAQAMCDETTMTKLAGAYRKRKKQLTEMKKVPS